MGTPISWVLPTPTRVYKIKKPLRRHARLPPPDGAASQRASQQ